MQKIRVLLIYDQPIAQAGLRTLVERLSVIQLVGEAAVGGGAAALVRSVKPEVILLSLDDARHEALETAALLSKKFPGVRIVAVSMFAGEEQILEALTNGIVGYLLKRFVADELEHALTSAARGQLFLSRTIPKKVRQACLQRLHGRRKAPAKLTARQLQVLRGIAQSKSTKEIALWLGLSAKTVEFHRAQLMERLKIYDIPGLVRYAVRTGLIRVESPSH